MKLDDIGFYALSNRGINMIKILRVSQKKRCVDCIGDVCPQYNHKYCAVYPPHTKKKFPEEKPEEPEII